jgi:hypothetical protein
MYVYATDLDKSDGVIFPPSPSGRRGVVILADRMLIGPDDGYQAGTGRLVNQHSLPCRSCHLVVFARYQPLCLVLAHYVLGQDVQVQDVQVLAHYVCVYGCMYSLLLTIHCLDFKTKIRLRAS